jgi:hypothetical protein
MKLNHQAVGAFGERAVEAELLRRDWIPANVNATVKNAADFDIYAVKKGHSVHLRVRACGPDSRAFQFGGFDPGEQVKIGNFSDTDFTVLVSMSSDRNRDQFYVVPSRVVREEIAQRRKQYLSVPRRDVRTIAMASERPIGRVRRPGRYAACERRAPAPPRRWIARLAHQTGILDP